MITCTSDRSGSASSGVLLTAKTPAAARKAAARSTINVFAADQRMMRSIIERAPVGSSR